MENIDTLSTYLKNILPTISQESIDTYKSLTTLQSFKKGDIFIDYGQMSYSGFIIKHGLVGSFVKQPDGNNFIRSIFKEFGSFGSAQTIMLKKKSNVVYQALTDGEAYHINHLDFIKHNTIEFKELQIKTLEKICLYLEQIITDLTSYDATYRYVQLRKAFKNIDNILPQYQIAHYLNITPVQLSRIRKKILEL